MTPAAIAPSVVHGWQINRRLGMPVFRQVYERVRHVIATGVMQPGDRIAAARVLASMIGTARGTVEEAYQLLVAEGYLRRDGARGTFISPKLIGFNKSTVGTEPGPRVSPKRVNRIAAATPAPAPTLAFRLGQPALDAFPLKIWSRLTAQHARRTGSAYMLSADPMGLPQLRQGIAAHLALARGIHCDAAQIIVTSGYQGALDLAIRVLLRANDSVWIEDPSYLRARRLFENANLAICPIPVDGDGMIVAGAVKQAPKARLAVVTPSHQSPMCVALSLARRLELLRWASAHESWVLEDDYDGEFHYAGRPIPALKSLDTADRVLYAGSFSKTLFPALRLGYLIVPMSLVEPFRRAASLRDAGLPALPQGVVAQFMTDGHFARHVRRMRLLYSERRAALVDALNTTFQHRLHTPLQTGGMLLIANVLSQTRDTELVKRASEKGYLIEALSAQAVLKNQYNALLLGFTNIASEQAMSQCRSLERALRTLL